MNNIELDLIEYKGKKYPTRDIDIKSPIDGEPLTIKIATLELQEAFEGKYEDWGTVESDIDCTIYYYVTDEQIKLSDEEIVANHLDEPITLIKLD